MPNDQPQVSSSDAAALRISRLQATVRELQERLAAVNNDGPITRYIREVAGLVPDAVRFTKANFRGSVPQSTAITQPTDVDLPKDYYFFARRMRAGVELTTATLNTNSNDLAEIEFNFQEVGLNYNLFLTDVNMLTLVSAASGSPIGDSEWDGGHRFRPGAKIKCVLSRLNSLSDANARVVAISLIGDLVHI